MPNDLKVLNMGCISCEEDLVVEVGYFMVCPQCGGRYMDEDQMARYRADLKSGKIKPEDQITA